MNTANEKKKNWKQKLVHEFVSYWFAVLYMAIFFAVFTNYRRLILAHYQIVYTEYGISVIKALVLAKVVLIAEAMRLGRGFEKQPLIIPTLYKTVVFTVCVAAFDILETVVRALIGGMGTAGAIDKVWGRFNYEWLASATVVFFAFIPFFAFRELKLIFGEGTIFRLFFQPRTAGEIDGPRPANTPPGQQAPAIEQGPAGDKKPRARTADPM